MSLQNLPVPQAVAGIRSPWLVPFDGKLDSAPAVYSAPDDAPDCKRRLRETREAVRPFKRRLYAGKQFSVLLIFQALDAAGKDGAIRELFEALDPANLKITAFKKPTPRESSHDFLWRTAKALPELGEIAVFNRSYYEEVLAVRVHPEFLDAQFAGQPPEADSLWPLRYRAIREHERHLAASGTLVPKFWLNVSPGRQARRFLERLDTAEKRWKFSRGDVRESTYREEYDSALRHMLNETSRPWAPWFCIPADDRWYLRWQVADIVRQGLARLPLEYPRLEEIPERQAEELRDLLRSRLR